MTETILGKVRVGVSFAFVPNGPVFVKVRGGFRPGRGGQLFASIPKSQPVWLLRS